MFRVYTSLLNHLIHLAVRSFAKGLGLLVNPFKTKGTGLSYHQLELLHAQGPVPLVLS